MGMDIVVCMLRRSLDKWIYRDTLQFETVRKLRSAHSNILYASRQILTTSVMVRDLKKTYITTFPAYGLWFEQFVIGIHKRLENNFHQDQVITLIVIHKLVDGLKNDYTSSGREEERKRGKSLLTKQSLF